MPISLTPEPDPDVAVALVEAACRAHVELEPVPSAYTSPWRQAGLEAAVCGARRCPGSVSATVTGDPEGHTYALSPRSMRGATRA